MPVVRIVGPGRAGGSIAAALVARGWDALASRGRDDDVTDAAEGVDLCIVSTPDDVVGAVAARIRPHAGAVVAHLSGSLTLEVLAPHARRASIHPLVSLPDPARGAAALLGGAWFAVAGDRLARQVVSDLGGRRVDVADADRVRYHAAACIASNHLVALLAQVERVAPAGVPLDAYLALVRATLDNVAAVGPAAALTGPAARGDWATVAAHLAALPEREREAYEALAGAAARLAGRPGLPEVVACS